MATLRVSHSCYVCHRCFLNVYKSKRLFFAARLLTTFEKEKFKYNQIGVPLLSVNRYRSLKDYVLFSTKSVKDKPENLESLVNYERVAEETLQSIYERFEDLLQDSSFEDWDANYSNGVLTITLEENNVYVLNKQTPNRQIWLSSPASGPKRYDYIEGTWIYKHDGNSLHQLLSDEIGQLLQKKADFTTCSFSS